MPEESEESALRFVHCVQHARLVISVNLIGQDTAKSLQQHFDVKHSNVKDREIVLEL
jgi:hypothetical protein